MPADLIHFPNPVEPYRDTGEGGLYVVLAVPEPRGHRYNCHVDVLINMGSPDATISDTGDLWAPGAQRGDGWQNAMDAQDALRKAGRDDLATWATRVIDPETEQSVDLLAAVHLGSTPHSLWNDQAGRYWEAGVEDLTEHGRALHAALEAAYGAPRILTFLDT
jgi:hypothetical protein